MRRDRRSVKEQVKSGLLIASKIVAAICLAGMFVAGYTLVREAQRSSQVAIGWILIILSIALISITVRFWAAGFVGFIGYSALRSLSGSLFADSVSTSPTTMFALAASLIAMTVLSIRFVSRNPRINQMERASLVIAATCCIASVPALGSYTGLALLNFGNIALLLSWLAARASNQGPKSSRKTTAPQ